jgi:O-antigen/teichoic acid export membrane protein
MTLSSKVAVNASALAVGRLLLAGAGILSVAITTRYLGLEAFGALTAATAFVGLLGPLTDIGISTIGARELAKRPAETERVMGSILTLGFVLALVAAGAGLIAMYVIYPGQSNDLVRQGILLLLLPLPLAAPVNAASAYFISQQKAYMGVIASVVGSLLTLGLLIAATLLDWGFVGVVFAYMGMGLGYGGCLVALALRKVRLRPCFDLALLSQLLRWALPLGAALIAHSVYWRIDIVLLSLLSSSSEVAVYGLAYRVIDALGALPYFVTVTLMPEFARLIDHRSRLDELLQKAFSVMQVTVVPLVVVFVIFGEEVIRLAGGSEFHESTLVLQILIISLVASYLGAVLGQALIALNQQSRLLVVSLALLLVNVALNLALIPLWDALGAAVALVLSEVLMLGALMGVYRRTGTIPKPHRAPQVLVAGSVMSAVTLALLSFLGSASAAVTLAIGGTVSTAVYIACLYALKAMPRELHAGLVAPLWSRLRPS